MVGIIDLLVFTSIMTITGLPLLLNYIGEERSGIGMRMKEALRIGKEVKKSMLYEFLSS